MTALASARTVAEAVGTGPDADGVGVAVALGVAGSLAMPRSLGRSHAPSHKPASKAAARAIGLMPRMLDPSVDSGNISCRLA